MNLGEEDGGRAKGGYLYVKSEPGQHSSLHALLALQIPAENSAPVFPTRVSYNWLLSCV
jgi:hypothetical protein